jgi:hypothetical protein
VGELEDDGGARDPLPGELEIVEPFAAPGHRSRLPATQTADVDRVDARATFDVHDRGVRTSSPGPPARRSSPAEA